MTGVYLVVGVLTSLEFQKTPNIQDFQVMFRMMGKETKQGLGVALELTKALGKVKSGNGHGQPVNEGS